MEYIDSYVDYFKSYNDNVEFLEKQMTTETEYYEKTKEYSVTQTATQTYTLKNSQTHQNTLYRKPRTSWARSSTRSQRTSCSPSRTTWRGLARNTSMRKSNTITATPTASTPPTRDKHF